MLKDREALEEFKDLKKRLHIEFVALDQRLTEISQRIGGYTQRIAEDLSDFRYARVKRYVEDLSATVTHLDETPLRVYAALARVAKDVLLDDWGTNFWAIPGKVGYTPSGEIPRWRETEPNNPASGGGSCASVIEKKVAGREDTSVELLDRIHRCADHIQDLFHSFAEIWTAVRSAAEIGDESALSFELDKLRQLPAELNAAFAAWANDVDLLYEVSPETLSYIRAVIWPIPGQQELF